jgi:HTH-type transcriptional regulator / antitoxin HigA
MTLTFDFAPTTYSNLLAEIAPRAIETEAEYDRLLAITEQLTFNKNKTPEERAIYQLLVILIETYESQQYPMPISPPHEILQHIMESSGTHQSYLVGKIGSSEVVSEIVDGTRSITNAQAKILGDMWKVSPSLFI